MKRYKSCLKEGMKYDSIYFEPSYNISDNDGEKLVTVLGESEVFVKELYRWKKMGVTHVKGFSGKGKGGEFIPLWN